MPRNPQLLGTMNPALRKAYREARRYLDRSEVTGVAVGEAIRGGKSAGPCISFLVDRKIKRKHLRGRSPLPKAIAGVPVDVVQREYKHRVLSLGERRARRSRPADPLVPGVQIALADQSFGTLGMFVTNFQNGRQCALTAGHVLTGPPGSAVFQPNDDRDELRIGTFVRRIVDATCDAGIFELQTSRAVANVPLGHVTRLRGVRPVRLHEVLAKSGCMTGVTAAAVQQAGEFKVEGATVSGFELLPVGATSEEISDSGDSGSVWFDALTGEAVGLSIAGDKGGSANSDEWALACHMPLVMDRLMIGA